MADEAANLSYKDQQQLFVSNLNGTSLLEIAVVTSSSSFALLLRACFVLVLFGSLSSNFLTKSSLIILLDFITLVLPVLGSVTFLADQTLTMLSTMATIICGLIVMATVFKYGNPESMQSKHYSHLMQTRMTGRQPFICNFRAYVLIATAVSILAVDFKIFPRRFAKAETYGSGLMDVGVGAFVVSNAIVSPEARQRGKDRDSLLRSLLRSVKSALPLLVLGIGRCLAVKSTDYQEHVSEYGVHWNFFFTLFVVRVLGTVIVGLVPGSSPYGIIGVVLAMLYQYCLSNTGLRQFVLHGSRGDGSRHGLVDANREGIVSCIGYLALYFMALELGRFLFSKRDTFGSWLKAFLALLVLDAVFWGLILACSEYVSPVSRRMANLSYILWQMAYSIQHLACYLLADLLITAVQKVLVTEGSPPGGCEICYPDYSHTALKREPIRTPHCVCLIAAINRNQLVYFLLANVLTGLVNFSVKTLFCDNSLSIAILCGYMFLLNLIILVFHVCGVTLRLH